MDEEDEKEIRNVSMGNDNSRFFRSSGENPFSRIEKAVRETTEEVRGLKVSVNVNSENIALLTKAQSELVRSHSDLTKSQSDCFRLVSQLASERGSSQERRGMY